MPPSNSTTVLSKLDAGEWGEDKTPALYTVKAVGPDIGPDIGPPVDLQLPSQADQTHARRVTQKAYTHPLPERAPSRRHSNSLKPGKQLPALNGRIFLMLGNTTEQQALELRHHGATVLCSPLPPKHTAINQDNVVIANPQAMADHLYWEAQALGCQMLDADALSAVLQRPSTMLNFLSAMPGNPAMSLSPSGTAEDASGPPVSNAPGHALAQQLQQQAYTTRDSLAPGDCSRSPGLLCKRSLQHPQHHHPASAGLDIASQQLQQDADCSTLAPCSGKHHGGQAVDKPLSGQTFVFLGSTKVISYKDKLFTVQHWQQQLQQLGAIVVNPQSFVAAALNSSRAHNSIAGTTGQTTVSISGSEECRDVVVVLTDTNTVASSTYQAAESLGCRVLDIEGLCNLLNYPMQLQNLLCMMPTANNAVHAAVPAVAQQIESGRAVHPGVVEAANMPGPNGSFRFGSIEQSLVPPASPTVQQAAALQIGKTKGITRNQSVYYQLQTSAALEGKTFMFVGNVKNRNSIIRKLASHGAHVVSTPNQCRFGPSVIVVAGSGAASRSQYAAAYELGCLMLRKKWLKTVIANPGKLDSLLESMAAPCVMMAAAWPSGQAQQHQVEQKHAASLKGAQTAPATVEYEAQQERQQHYREYKAETREHKTEANMHRHGGNKAVPKHLQQQAAASAANRPGLNDTNNGSAASAAKVMVLTSDVSSDSEASEGTEWINKYAAIYCSQESGLVA